MGLKDDSSSFMGHELGPELCRDHISALMEEAGHISALREESHFGSLLADCLSKVQAHHTNTLLIIQGFLGLQVSVPHSGGMCELTWMKSLSHIHACHSSCIKEGSCGYKGIIPSHTGLIK